MKLCNEIITVFNKKLDPDKGWDTYNATVIKKVSWYSHIVSAVDSTGLHAANEFIVRIPMDADFGGKVYVDPITYENEAMTAGIFTLANGDIVVKGMVDETLTPAQLKEQNYEYCTILGVTDNRRAPNAPHFRVVGS